ncbi:MAG: DUF58 domain-containing protein [Phycisphaerales bacterium]|nr:DUF58 domain-containing protein [Phycisphaerales bacterium]
MLASKASAVRPSLAFILALMLVLPPAFLRGNNLLVLMLVMVLAAAVLGLIMPGLSLSGVRVRRQLPRHGRVGEPMRIRYQVSRDRGHFWPAFSVGIDEHLDGVEVDITQSAWLLHVASGDTVHGDLLFVPKTRGRLVLDRITAGTSFPFGLHRAKRRFGPRREVVVHPRTRPVPASLLRAARGAGLDGPRSSRARGQGDEWHGTRPARPGERLRDIAWRVSAHRDELVALERTCPRPPRMMVVLDLTRETASLDEADLEVARQLEEAAIECAASLLMEGHQSGDEVGLRVLGMEAAAHDPRRGSLHVDRMMTTLALLDLDAHRASPRMDCGDRSGVIVVQPDRIRPLAAMPGALHLSARTWRSRMETP